MRRFNTRLKFGICLASLIAASMTTVAQAQEAAPAEEQATMKAVVVEGRRVSTADTAIGQNEATNTVAVTRDELLSAPGGISGLKMLESLPGFNVQTDGALGLYEFGNSVTVRAFNLQQIGFVLDGVPMGRSDAFGGSPIFRYVDNENLGSVVASPGAGDVSLPSYASLGPIVSYNTIDTSDEAGGILSYTMGDDNLERSFIKLETGDINGFSAYISRSKTDSDLWRGPGTIDREHIEGKIKYEFDEDTFIKFGYVHNDFFDYDSPSGPEATFENDYYYGYLDAIPETGCINQISGVYDYNGDSVIDGNDFSPIYTGSSCTSYYEDRINIRDDSLYSLNFQTDLAPGLMFKATAYQEDKDGYGVSPDSYSNSLNIYNRQVAAGLDVVHPRGVQYGLSGVGGTRKGAVAGLEWQVANHKLEAGVWYEDEDYNRTQQRLNKTNGSADGDVIWDEVAYYRRDYTSTRKTTQFYLKDTISLMEDKLNVEVGVKSLSVDYELSGYRDYNDYELFGPQTVGEDYSDNFLPMIGAVYDLNDTDQIFASYSQNYALPRGADDIFSIASTDASTEPLPAPKGEESKNYEIGVRTNRAQFYGSAALFYTTFDNRLVSGSVINPATEQPEAFYINAGETESYGFELSGVYQPAFLGDKVFLDGNLTYNHAENEGGFILADSPEWLFTGGITYEPTEWLVANVSGKYTGERYADFTEGYDMDSYTVLSGYLDLGGPNDFGIPENVSLRFNIDNLLDEEVPTAFVFAGSAFFRPLNPRTFQATLTVRF
ncbi:TonB-dependent receptor domain-containing protein [uncultured Hyphomonas sp.]|uniref:TonB-dependent receptor n=1 Tax=uncultured Hyphomonas sp. TaxID=225298 RepID=UPI002AAB856E|nr:TonB-dependent receptor [uncultured Hyphomonas sp.]